jgi:D-arabinose 1-dehydrogenase-like Zn-dependent alcohol dehydrogenase
MKAAVFDGVKIQIKNVPKPKQSKNQALIRVKACGICGTDIAIIQGHLTTPVPLILGHEFAGEVVGVGSEVPVSWIGKHVTAEINPHTCGQCYYSQFFLTQTWALSISECLRLDVDSSNESVGGSSCLVIW